MTDDVKILYAIEISNIFDYDGNQINDLYIEVSQLEAQQWIFDLADEDAVFIMACQYAVDVLGYADASMAMYAKFYWDRPDWA